MTSTTTRHDRYAPAKRALGLAFVVAAAIVTGTLIDALALGGASLIAH